MSDLYVKPSAGRLDSRQNSTDYDHPQETNLLNLHKAMEYDLGGKPMLRVAAKLSGPGIAGQVSAFGEPLAISPGSQISIAIQSTAQISRMDCALTWSED